MTYKNLTLYILILNISELKLIMSFSKDIFEIYE